MKSFLKFANIVLIIFGIFCVLYGFSLITEYSVDSSYEMAIKIGGGFSLLSGSIILAVEAYIGFKKYNK